MTINLNMKLDQNKNKHFEQWAEDKSPMLKLASFLFAGDLEVFLEFLQDVKDGKKVGLYDRLPPADQWLKFYRNHRKINRGVSDAFRQINDDMAKLIGYYEKHMFSVSILKHVTKNELQEIKEELTSAEKKRVKARNQEIQEMIANDFNIGKVDTKEEKEKIAALLNKPEVIFFARVWAPCLFLYGEYSTSLLRKARQGDEDALEKLLRLDQTIIADKKIMELFHQGKIARRQATYDLFTKALSKKPRVKLTRQKLKHEMAGLISAISISMGQKISTPDIKGLFDAISKDNGKGDDADFHDENQPEALSKAVNRARRKWKTIHQPDKK